MGVRTRTLITVLLVGAVIGVFTLQITNPNLFRGQIFNQPDDMGDDLDVIEGTPDLVPKLEIIPPETADGDIEVSATIENNGTAAIDGSAPFRYAIFINDIEVFSNTDSYSTVEPGDSFNFIYPIPRSIYQYPDNGTIRIELDTENSIEESSENNNQLTLDYSI